MGYICIPRLFIGAKFAKRKEFHDDFLSLESSKILQGLAAWGLLFTAVFFLTYRFIKKETICLSSLAIICFYGLYKLAVFRGTVAGYYREWEGYPGYGEKALTLVIQSMTCVAFVYSIVGA